jgi:hypothetical protein
MFNLLYNRRQVRADKSALAPENSVWLRMNGIEQKQAFTERVYSGTRVYSRHSRKVVVQVMRHLEFSRIERRLAFLAGAVNLFVGMGFFFLPELQLPLWPTSIPAILDRFIGAIILGNAAGAFWLSNEHEWGRVRPLALVALVYGTLVAAALLYHLLWLQADSTFWLYFAFDLPFLLVYYALFLYHDIWPLLARRARTKSFQERSKVG